MMADFIAAAFVCLIIYILVRPSSQGTQFVQAFSSAFAAIVANAADLASTTGADSSTGGTSNG